MEKLVKILKIFFENNILKYILYMSILINDCFFKLTNEKMTKNENYK